MKNRKFKNEDIVLTNECVCNCEFTNCNITINNNVLFFKCIFRDVNFIRESELNLSRNELYCCKLNGLVLTKSEIFRNDFYNCEIIKNNVNGFISFNKFYNCKIEKNCINKSEVYHFICYDGKLLDNVIVKTNYKYCFDVNMKEIRYNR